MTLEPTSQDDVAYSLLPFFELAEDYLCIAGYDGYFKRVNPAFRKLLGYTEKELLSFPIKNLIYEPDQEATWENKERLLEGIPLVNFENRYITRNGEIVWLTWTSIPVQSNQLVYAIAKNITHIKNKENERNCLITDLTNLNKELTQLSYTTTHDLKSPVNNLISLFSLMDLSEIKNQDNILYLDLLKQSAESLKDILNNYIDTIQDKKKSYVKKENIDLQQVLKKTIEPIRYLMQSKNTLISEDFSEAHFLKFNSFYLHSIFLNLISNSINYARPGIRPEIKITSKKIENYILLIFKDNGQGFDLNKIGDKLFGLNETFHHHSESKGVGLYLVDNYMRELGGSLSLESKVNQGATFTLKFKN